MWVEHVLTAQNKMAIWTCGILRELILGTRQARSQGGSGDSKEPPKF